MPHPTPHLCLRPAKRSRRMTVFHSLASQGNFPRKFWRRRCALWCRFIEMSGCGGVRACRRGVTTSGAINGQRAPWIICHRTPVRQARRSGHIFHAPPHADHWTLPRAHRQRPAFAGDLQRAGAACAHGDPHARRDPHGLRATWWRRMHYVTVSSFYSTHRS